MFGRTAGPSIAVAVTLGTLVLGVPPALAQATATITADVSAAPIATAPTTVPETPTSAPTTTDWAAAIDWDPTGDLAATGPGSRTRWIAVLAVILLAVGILLSAATRPHGRG